MYLCYRLKISLRGVGRQERLCNIWLVLIVSQDRTHLDQPIKVKTPNQGQIFPLYNFFEQEKLFLFKIYDERYFSKWNYDVKVVFYCLFQWFTSKINNLTSFRGKKKRILNKLFIILSRNSICKVLNCLLYNH